MTQTEVRRAWREFIANVLHPMPMLGLAVLAGLVYLALHRDPDFRMPSPPPYMVELMGGCPTSSTGEEFCTELADGAQMHSFTLHWIGWALAALGGLFALAMALREDAPRIARPPGDSEPPPPRRPLGLYLSEKNLSIFAVAIGGAVAAYGNETLNRATDATNAAADATKVLGELAVLRDVCGTGSHSGVRHDAELSDAGVELTDGGHSKSEAGSADTGASQVLGDAGPAAGASSGHDVLDAGSPNATKAQARCSCREQPTPDQVAYRSCAAIKSQWLSGRSATTFLEQWQTTLKVTKPQSTMAE